MMKQKLLHFITLLMVLSAMLSCKALLTAMLEENENHDESEQINYDAVRKYPWFDPIEFETNNKAYKNDIATVELKRSGVEFSMPLVELGSTDQLLLSFDVLDGNPQYFNYTYIHCNANWEPSGLVRSEYISPYTESYFKNYLLSRATRQSYIHYELLIPNDEMEVTKSGNYLLVIYDPNNNNQLVLTRRFMVMEPKVIIDVSIKKSSVVEEASYRQEVDFDIIKTNWPIDNPFSELTVYVQQNGRSDNMLKGLTPRLISGSKISYNWERINTFDGGNEFRHLDLRTFSRITPRVAYINRDSTYFHVFVKPDYKRGMLVYQSDKDINGEFVVINEDAHTNNGNEEDYAFVHFTFPFKSHFSNRDIYIYGALTNWQISPNSKMKYNTAKQTYENTLFLKQGYYNYQYVMIDTTGTKLETVLTEGDHSETENFYTVYVYQRLPSEYYDRLIGVERVTTLQRQ